MSTIAIRSANADDYNAIWTILAPVIRAGETYALPPQMDRDDALEYWCGAGKQVFVAERGDAILGTYYLRANQMGPGGHVCNCGYVTAEAARGQGIAAQMCQHSLKAASDSGFRAMQFNLVATSNTGAVRLWTRLGFETIGTLPGAFAHPKLGDVDALVMYQRLNLPARS